MAAKRRPKTKPRARKRRKKPAFSPGVQFMKILAGLSLLLCLVVTAGMLANRLLQRPEPPPQATAPAQAVQSAKGDGVHHSVPDYEAFHREAVPPPPPIKRVKPVTNGVPVAIIIDDIGYDRKMAERFLALDIPLTFSVLPMGTFNRSIVRQALARDVEIMLHQPMEPEHYPTVNPGPAALLSAMAPDELITQLTANLDNLPSAKGINNHMGSRLTANADQMRQVFTVLKKRDLFFVDSRTTTATVCRPSAALLHLPFAERDVFIDHIQTPEFVEKQLKLLVRRARRQGYAIGIAHPNPVTLTVLSRMLPEMKQALLFTTASEVVAFQQG